MRLLNRIAQKVGFRVVRVERIVRDSTINAELHRLRTAPDFSVGHTSVFGKPFRLVSNRAFSYLYKEIFAREIYRFSSMQSSPLILDCGANIGVSTLYFKKLFPDSRVWSFEPSDEVFPVLSENVGTLLGVSLVKAAVWNEDCKLRFNSDPQSTAGHVVPENNHTAISEVNAVRLRNYLNEPVSMLKVDIEGAESVVIPDIADRLHLVENIFIEYHSRDGEPQSLTRILEILECAGFETYLESGPSTTKHPFVERGTYKGMTMLINIFGRRLSP